MSQPRDHDEPGQPEMLPGLARAAARRGRAPAKKPPVTAAEVDPVARVLVDLPLAHLDRPFDYLVPETMAADAVPGARVKVRFAGQDVDAYVVARAAASDHDGRLSPLRRVVSAEPVLAPEIAALSADVARRYAGARADVLRLAVPPRHATAEKKDSVPAPPPDARTGGGRGQALGRARPRGRLRGGARRRGLAAGGLVGGPGCRLADAARPGGGGDVRLGPRRAALRPRRQGRRPGGRGAARGRWGEGHHVALRADSGPSARYRDFLAVSRGARRIVVGTRAAAFAPVHDLGPGRGLGRRRRPARRAPGAVPAHPRGAAHPRRAAGHRRAGRRLRAHRRGGVPPHHRLGPRDRPVPGVAPRAGHRSG